MAIKLSNLKMPMEKKKLASDAEMSDLSSDTGSNESDTSSEDGSGDGEEHNQDQSTESGGGKDALSGASDQDLLAEIKKRGLMDQIGKAEDLLEGDLS